MALTERSRHKLFEVFHDLVDDEQAVQEMLSYFPARDVEEPVTKDFFRAELQAVFGVHRAETQAEIGGLRAEMQSEIGGLRAEMQAQIGGLRAEMQAEIGGLRAEMQSEFGAVRGEIHELRAETQAEFGAVRREIHELRTEMHTLVRSLQTWTVTVGVSLAGLMLAIARFG